MTTSINSAGIIMAAGLVVDFVLRLVLVLLRLMVVRVMMMMMSLITMIMMMSMMSVDALICSGVE